MGMAAGQARLLSITSRMSDNELRAQIINNRKMRLATESSQVSENYVNALNQAQMMFTNYDADNNASYQQLTFNSLTSYNPYNNQYGLVNASGQILVSEQDAKNYINADGDLEKFLASYGLEQTTTYFDGLDQYNTTYTDENGTVIYNPAEYPEGTIPYRTTDENGNITYTNSGYTAEQLEIMFLGGKEVRDDGTTIYHSGYDNAIYSAVYNDYIGYATQFDNALNAYSETIADQMGNKYYALTGSGGKSFQDISKYFEETFVSSDYDSNQGTTKSVANQHIQALKDLLTQMNTNYIAKDTNGEPISDYYENLITQLDGLQSGWSINTLSTVSKSTDVDNKVEYEKDDATGNETIDIGNNITITKAADGTYSLSIDGTQITGGTINGSTTEIIINEKEIPAATQDGDPTYKTEIGTSESDVDFNYKLTFNIGNSSVNLNELFTYAKQASEGNYTGDDIDICQESKVSGEALKNTIKSMITAVQNSIYTLWDTSNPEFTQINGKESDAHLAYRQAAANFIVNLLNNGTSWSDDEENRYTVGEVKQEPAGAGYEEAVSSIKIIGPDKTEYVIDLNTITALATNMESLQDALENGITPDSPAGEKLYFDRDEIQDLLDVVVLNNIMNTYGEPKVAWIDKYDGNVNGEAKAEWYSNLFSRMQKGFKVLQDGLASSSEWIQFALENGIVTMEQVDTESNWNGLNYANCSDITEQTNDKAVTLAEAEYNAAMNKIENKDKKYDLELKNIDTEHNSLQTEYDSIKTAIDKNIERTFKIYS